MCDQKVYGCVCVRATSNEGRQIFVVVMGSNSKELRFVDAHVLAQWAWGVLKRTDSSD